MNNYFDTFDKKDCNGCGTCALRCPKGAITMKEDEEGFFYPVIDEKKCINCGLCKKICSNNPIINNYESQVYAVKNKYEEERLLSTSGGMFKILAKNIIAKNGVVFGVKFNENLKAIHDYSEDIDGCNEFSISKYVRSDLNDSYQKVEQFLKNDRYVLFTGTPCQNYGLKRYLSKDYEKLVTCEIVCHSNPSPKIFELYKRNIENNNDKKISKYYFRSKNKNTNKPYVEFQDGSIKEYPIFNNAFNNMLISRPSCSNCHFSNINRKSDFTIGDFWGIDNYVPKFNDKKGVSLVCINSLKANKIFEEVKNLIDYKEFTLDEAFKYNHHSNISENKYRKKFFKGILNKNINETNIIKYMNKYTRRPVYKKVLGKLKKIIKIKS